MRLICFTAACLFAVPASMTVMPAVAQEAPAGSYKETCSAISVSGTTLKATCKTFSQANNATELPYYGSCIGDIGNVNGTLACTGPDGSYALTCKDASVSGTALSAQCKTKAGQYVSTSLPNFQGFQGNISNCDGKLRNGNC